MRFSLSHLLGLLFLVALLFPLVQSMRSYEQRLAEKQRLMNEVRTLEQVTRSGDEDWELWLQRYGEEVDSLHAIRLNAEAAFAEFQTKYGGVEPRGSDVFSFRGVPQLRTDNQRYAPIAYRCWVPEKRDIWVKCAIAPEDSHEQTVTKLDALKAPLESTGFFYQDCFELKLEPGEQLLKFHCQEPVDGRMTYSLRVSGTTVFQSYYEDKDVAGSSYSYITPRTQDDRESTEPLSQLLEMHVRFLPGKGKPSRGDYKTIVWLSDSSSGFATFPTPGRDE